jgi:hypothetical protein
MASCRMPGRQIETFAKLSLFVISTKGRNLNGLESLRFLVVDTPRNDKIQRSRFGGLVMTNCFKNDAIGAKFYVHKRR